jgi:asparagine synthase (glutamine-hydrolysing)
LGVLFSSGKDSTYAAYVMKKQNYEITCLITIKSENPDSYMFHTPAIEIAELQAEAMGIPIIFKKTKGEKEKELEDLEKAIIEAKEKYKIDGIVTGALFSDYQRSRVEKICDKLGLKIFSPLWHIDQEKEMRQIIDSGFEIVMAAIAAEGLDKKWLMKVLTQNDVDKLVELNKKYKINIAGEGGEFETLVLNCPLFKKRITIKNYEIVVDKNSARVMIK